MITLNVNGIDHQVDVPSGTPLLWVLRDTLGLTGTKYGCGIEECGACTVLIDGQAQRTCEMSASEAVGRAIVTIEGLSPDRSHPLQKAWIAEQVPQCGYCQSGMIMRAVALLNEHPHPNDSDINEIDNICVCGTYQRIRAAIKRAANGG
jgi:isoquinoline 1-oxidoreductase alpha subunit